MGKNWIGFQPMIKPVPGRTLHEKASFPSHVGAAEVVALITTRAGLEQWLAPVTAFSQKRGGDIEFLAADGPFTGSFTRLDVPRAVVLMTDRHGEIAINLDVRRTDARVDMRGADTRVNVQITRFVADSEDEQQVLDLLRATIAMLKDRCAGGS